MWAYEYSSVTRALAYHGGDPGFDPHITEQNKERNVDHIYNGILFNLKKKEILLFSATWIKDIIFFIFYIF